MVTVLEWVPVIIHTMPDSISSVNRTLIVGYHGHIKCRNIETVLSTHDQHAFDTLDHI